MPDRSPSMRCDMRRLRISLSSHTRKWALSKPTTITSTVRVPRVHCPQDIGRAAWRGSALSVTPVRLGCQLSAEQSELRVQRVQRIAGAVLVRWSRTPPAPRAFWGLGC